MGPTVKSGDIDGIKRYVTDIEGGGPRWDVDQGLVALLKNHDTALQTISNATDTEWGQYGTREDVVAPILDEKLGLTSLFRLADDRRGLLARFMELTNRRGQEYSYSFFYKRETDHPVEGDVHATALIGIQFNAVRRDDGSVRYLSPDLRVVWPLNAGYSETKVFTGLDDRSHLLWVGGNNVDTLKQVSIERYNKEFDVIKIIVDWPTLAVNPWLTVTPAYGSLDLSESPLLHSIGTFRGPNGSLVGTLICEQHVSGDPMGADLALELKDGETRATTGDAIYDFVKAEISKLRIADSDARGAIETRIDVFQRANNRFNKITNLWLETLSTAQGVSNYPKYASEPDIPADVDVAILADADGTPAFFIRDANNPDQDFIPLASHVNSNSDVALEAINQVITSVGGFAYAGNDNTDELDALRADIGTLTTPEELKVIIDKLEASIAAVDDKVTGSTGGSVGRQGGTLGLYQSSTMQQGDYSDKADVLGITAFADNITYTLLDKKHLKLITNESIAGRDITLLEADGITVLGVLPPGRTVNAGQDPNGNWWFDLKPEGLNTDALNLKVTDLEDAVALLQNITPEKPYIDPPAVNTLDWTALDLDASQYDLASYGLKIKLVNGTTKQTVSLPSNGGVNEGKTVVIWNATNLSQDVGLGSRDARNTKTGLLETDNPIITLKSGKIVTIVSVDFATTEYTINEVAKAVDLSVFDYQSQSDLSFVEMTGASISNSDTVMRSVVAQRLVKDNGMMGQLEFTRFKDKSLHLSIKPINPDHKTITIVYMNADGTTDYQVRVIDWTDIDNITLAPSAIFDTMGEGNISIKGGVFANGIFSCVLAINDTDGSVSDNQVLQFGLYTQDSKGATAPFGYDVVISEIKEEVVIKPFDSGLIGIEQLIPYRFHKNHQVYGMVFEYTGTIKNRNSTDRRDFIKPLLNGPAMEDIREVVDKSDFLSESTFYDKKDGSDADTSATVGGTLGWKDYHGLIVGNTDLFVSGASGDKLQGLCLSNTSTEDISLDKVNFTVYYTKT